MTIRISWPALGLALAVAALAVAAALEVGPPTASARTAREVVTAQDGIVQSTVTATGNVEPATDVTVGFQTSGVLQALDVKLGQHVDAGQLLATLDPTAAQLTVDQAQENLAAAEDQLANAENLQSQASSSSASTSASAAASDPPRSGGGAGSSSRGSSTRSSGSSAGGSSAGSAGGSAAGGSSAGGSAAGGSSGSGSAESADSLAAGVASAQAAVDGAEAALRTAENELSETRLFAPVSGTVVSLADIAPGQVVSATSGLGSGSGSGTGASATSRSSATSGSASGASGSGASGSSSSSGSGSSGLVEIASTRSLVMTVSLSEADISQVHVGDNATVTFDALTGVELPARLTSISPLGTSSSGVVTYDATLTLTATDPQVRPGMSASASIITAQASGVNLPSAAVSATSGSVAHVEVLDGSREVSTPVVVGLVGDTRTQIVSGLRAGQQVVVTETLPSLSATPAGLAASASGEPCDAGAPPLVEGLGADERASGDLARAGDQDLSGGRDRGSGAARHHGERLARRVRGHHRCVGQRQEHPDAHPRLPGPTDLRHLPPRRPGCRVGRRGRPRRPEKPRDRLRVPELQPAPAHARAGQRGAPARLRRASPGRPAAPRGAGARGRRAAGSGPPRAIAAVRRPAAAGGDRPRPGHQSRADPRRRADRKPGHGIDGGDNEPVRPPLRRGADDRADNARGDRRGTRRSCDRAVGRADRRRAQGGPGGPRVTEVLRTAVTSLAANRLRTGLAVLGLMIGVGAVIVLVAVGTGSSAAVQNRIEALGSNVLLVTAAPTLGGPGAGATTSLTLADATALQNRFQAPDVLSASPVVNVPDATLTFGETSYTPSSLVGSTPS